MIPRGRKCIISEPKFLKMKNFIRATTLICIFPLFISASVKPHGVIQQTEVFPARQKILAEPRASFDKIWVDYDITEDGSKGMRIHVKFTTYEMLNTDAYLAIYFEYDNEAATTLKDKNSKYNSTDGDVAVYKSIKPQYDPAVYDDLQLFMPYNELDLEAGKYNLIMDVKVIYKQGGAISKLTKYNFEYTSPGNSTTNSSTGGNASFEKMWVDYDVYESGLKGMRIHVNFTVNQMKGRDCYILITFEKKEGEKYFYMSSKNYNDYSNLIGDLITYKKLTPCCDVTNYNDLQVFMPYNELDLSSGKYDLRMDVDVTKSIDVIDESNSDFVGHLNYYTFWYTKE